MLKLSRREKQWQSYQRGIGEADVFMLSFALPLAFMFANYLVNLVGQFTWVKLGSLEALLRPVEQLDKEVEIG